MGKTELVLHFSEKKPHIYFLCEKVSHKYQLSKFTQALGAFFNDMFLPKDGFSDWETAFRYLASKKQKMAIVIDEFPYLVEADAAIPSTFQKAWDLYLKDSEVYLVLLGSSIAMMERTTLHYKAPLYGRRTGQLLISPFTFKTLEKVFPKATFEEQLMIYSTVGGTPFYLNRFRDAPYLEMVKQHMLQKGEPLYEEVEFLLREELREPRNYFVILAALSLGKHKLSELINETGFDKGTVSRYLGILERLGIARKEIPVTEKVPEKSRKGIYIVEDNFFNFWFRFVFRNRALLEANKIEAVVRSIKEAAPVLLARNYERIAKDILADYVLENQISIPFERYGRWWDRNEEIDLVAFSQHTQEILFGEVKWSNKPVGTDIYDALRAKAAGVEWGKKGRKEYFALFSKSGYTPAMIERGREDQVFLFHQERIVLPKRHSI